MSNAAVILQILFITIGMFVLGLVLNRILGLRKETIREFREKALNLKDRMRNAQVLGDAQLMLQLQQETLQFTKQIMLKQIIPLCLRCSIFIGVIAVLGFIYNDYDKGLLPFPILIFGSGWLALYFLFSISLSLIAYGGRRLYKKLTGKEIRTQKDLRDLIQLISPTPQRSGFSLPITGNSSGSIQEKNQPEEKDGWKERIQK
ncbi:MAG: hypothetical protein ACFFHD_04355 [Promethearchaeota archaeon]